MCDACDGETEQEFWDRVSSVLTTQGWFLQAVEGEDERNPPFAYTVGLTMIGHPELICFGMHPECAHAAMAPLVRLIQAGRRFDEGDDLTGVHDSAGPAAQLLRFPDSSTHLFRANDLFRNGDESPVSALQLFWPSEEPLLRSASLGRSSR